LRKMDTIRFTQYLRPDGRQRTVYFECDNPEVTAKAKDIERRGFIFECEELMNGMVSLTINDLHEEEDLAMELVMNGPGVPGAVEKLVKEFHAEMTEKGL